MKCPCQSCKDHSAYCHGDCKRYAKWSDYREDLKKRERKAREKEKLGIPRGKKPWMQ